MVRFIGGLVGLGFIFALLAAIFTTPLTIEENATEAFHQHPLALALSSDGVAPHWDQAQLQRGLKVFKEVCSACHSIRHVSFRDFAQLGYNEAQVKAIAAGWSAQAPSIDPNTGEAASRPPIPTDAVPGPFLNETAARAANNNAQPPDLSLITKARYGGAAYVYSLLKGYRSPPANLPASLRTTSTTLHYNPWFANLNIAMTPPLTSDGQVTFDDGTPATVDQMAKDVAAFLVWTAEPSLVTRHQVGWAALLFLLAFTSLAYLSYRSIWDDTAH